MISHNTTIFPQQIFIKSNDYTILKNDKMKSDITFELKNFIHIPNNVDAYIQLNSFKFMNAFYNINSTNNKFYYSISPNITTILSFTIPSGNYNITTFLDFMNTTLAGAITLAYNSTLFKINFQSSNSFILRKGINDCMGVIGFDSTTTASTNINSTNLINLLGVQVLYLCIDNLNLTSNSSKNSTVSNVLESVNVDVLIGSSQSYYNTTNTKYKINNSNINYLDIKIYGSDGKLVDFNNTDWYLGISFIFAYKMEYKPPTFLDLNSNGIDDRLETNINTSNNNI